MSEKIFEVHPKKSISGILPNNKRIMDPMQLPLSRAEFLRCMNFGTVYAIVDGERVLVTDLDYDKALKLFDTPVHFDTKTITFTDKVKLEDKVTIAPVPEEKPDKEPPMEPEKSEEPPVEEKTVENEESSSPQPTNNQEQNKPNVQRSAHARRHQQKKNK